MMYLFHSVKEAFAFALIYLVFDLLQEKKEPKPIRLVQYVKFMGAYVFMSTVLYKLDVTTGKTINNSSAAILGSWILGLMK